MTANSADYATNIQTLLDDDYNVIVTVGFALGAATLEAATANPDIHFIGVDQFQAGDDPVAGAGLANYESLIFNEAQAGYLAGIVAASISQSNVIAAIGGSGTIPPVVNYMRGYENGAKSVKADITVHLKYVSQRPGGRVQRPDHRQVVRRPVPVAEPGHRRDVPGGRQDR